MINGQNHSSQEEIELKSTLWMNDFKNVTVNFPTRQLISFQRFFPNDRLIWIWNAFYIFRIFFQMAFKSNEFFK